MIELILQAERALTAGMVDQAERLYGQAIEHDPRNSIAVVGLARVALERGDDGAAYRFARRALEIDAENVAARRLVARLSEVMAYRGETLPDGAVPDGAMPDERRRDAGPAPAAQAPAAAERTAGEAPMTRSPGRDIASTDAPRGGPGRRRGLFARLRGRH